jgi:hypothetical protein
MLTIIDPRIIVTIPIHWTNERCSFKKNRPNIAAIKGLVAVIAVTIATGITLIQVVYSIEPTLRPITADPIKYFQPALGTLRRGIICPGKNFIMIMRWDQEKMSNATER